MSGLAVQYTELKHPRRTLGKFSCFLEVLASAPRRATGQEQPAVGQVLLLVTTTKRTARAGTPDPTLERGSALRYTVPPALPT